jgi:hypothetical protein
MEKKKVRLGDKATPGRRCWEQFETIELERRSGAWTTLDLAFWKQVSLGDWPKRNERGRPVNKTRSISCVMQKNSDKSREYWRAMRHGQDGELN